jgi:hypothetical protein
MYIPGESFIQADTGNFALPRSSHRGELGFVYIVTSTLTPPSAIAAVSSQLSRRCAGTA